jgi:hypothetical protein
MQPHHLYRRVKVKVPKEQHVEFDNLHDNLRCNRVVSVIAIVFCLVSFALSVTAIVASDWNISVQDVVCTCNADIVAASLNKAELKGDPGNCSSPVNGSLIILGNITADNFYLSSNGGSLLVTSDERLKQDIQDLPDVAHLLQQLRVVSFRYKSHPRKKHYGVIAQELQKVIPDAVQEVNGTLMVDTNVLFMHLLKTVLELPGVRKPREFTWPPGDEIIYVPL